MFNQNTSPKNKRTLGFSLIEMLLVLGVLAVLLLAAFVVYPRVRDASRANAEVSHLALMKAAVSNLYASKGGNYEGLDNEVANKARVFPSTMNGGDYTTKTLTSSWGGNVRISPSPDLTSPQRILANRAFLVTYERVPESVCLGMISGASDNFFKITINNVDVITARNGAKPTLDMDSFTMRCTTAPAPPTISFYSE